MKRIFFIPCIAATLGVGAPLAHAAHYELCSAIHSAHIRCTDSGDIGTIHDVLIDPSEGRIVTVITSVDNRLIPVPWSECQAGDDPSIVTIRTSREDLVAAPAIEEAQIATFSPELYQRTDTFFRERGSHHSTTEINDRTNGGSYDAQRSSDPSTNDRRGSTGTIDENGRTSARDAARSGERLDAAGGRVRDEANSGERNATRAAERSASADAAGLQSSHKHHQAGDTAAATDRADRANAADATSSADRAATKAEDRAGNLTGGHTRATEQGDEATATARQSRKSEDGIGGGNAASTESADHASNARSASEEAGAAARETSKSARSHASAAEEIGSSHATHEHADGAGASESKSDKQQPQ